MKISCYSKYNKIGIILLSILIFGNHSCSKNNSISNYNNLPKYDSYYPESNSLTVNLGECIPFQIFGTSDADGDIISVKWFLNEEYTNAGTTFIYKVKEENENKAIVKADLSDGKDSLEIKWLIQILDRDLVTYPQSITLNDYNYYHLDISPPSCLTENSEIQILFDGEEGLPDGFFFYVEKEGDIRSGSVGYYFNQPGRIHIYGFPPFNLSNGNHLINVLYDGLKGQAEFEYESPSSLPIFNVEINVGIKSVDSTIIPSYSFNYGNVVSLQLIVTNTSQENKTLGFSGDWTNLCMESSIQVPNFYLVDKEYNNIFQICNLDKYLPDHEGMNCLNFTQQTDPLPGEPLHKEFSPHESYIYAECEFDTDFLQNIYFSSREFYVVYTKHPKDLLSIFFSIPNYVKIEIE